MASDPARGAGCIAYPGTVHCWAIVSDPARGAGCIVIYIVDNSPTIRFPTPRGARVASLSPRPIRPQLTVSDPARGAGCIENYEEEREDKYVSDPARGAGCISRRVRQGQGFGRVSDPARGAGCIMRYHFKKPAILFPTPRGARVASGRTGVIINFVCGFRPREGRGLHPNGQTHS